LIRVKRGNWLICASVRDTGAGVGELLRFQFPRSIVVAPTVSIEPVWKFGALTPSDEGVGIRLAKLLLRNQTVRELFEHYIGRDRSHATD
jgi:hypothetical protein